MPKIGREKNTREWSTKETQFKKTERVALTAQRLNFSQSCGAVGRKDVDPCA